MVNEAFQLMRLKRSQSGGSEELFNFFLVNAEKLDKLGLILQLNLTLYFTNGRNIRILDSYSKKGINKGFTSF